MTIYNFNIKKIILCAIIGIFVFGAYSGVNAGYVSVSPSSYIIQDTSLPISVTLSWNAYSEYNDTPTDLKCTASSDPEGIWSGDIPAGRGTKTISISTSRSVTFFLTCCATGTKIIRGEETEGYFCDTSQTAVIPISKVGYYPATVSVSPHTITQGQTANLQLNINRMQLISLTGGSCQFKSSISTPVVEFALNNCQHLTEYRFGRNFCRGHRVKTLNDFNNAILFAYIDLETMCLSPRECFTDPYNWQGTDSWGITIKPETSTTFTISCKPTAGGSIKVCFADTAPSTINDATGKVEWRGVLFDCNDGKIIDSATAYISYRDCKDVAISGTNSASWGNTITATAWDTISSLNAGFIGLGGYVTYEGGGSNYQDSDSIQVVDKLDNAISISLSAQPNEVTKGATSTISYSVLNASTSTPCTITSTDNVWQPTISLDNEGKATGSEVVTLPDFKTYEFGLTCYDKDHNPKTATTTVNVTETTKKYNCDTRGGCLESTTGTLTKSQCDSDCKYHCINGSSGSVCDLKYSFDSTKTLKICSTTADCLPPRPSCNLTLTANPSRIILGQDLNLIWSVGDNCDKDTCQATVTPETGGNWFGNPYNLPTTKLDTPVLTYNTTSVKPTKANTYTYTLQCDGKNTETVAGVVNIEVRVIPLPFWREIIPNLQGFLRGLVR